jgi:transcriptional regulator with XRE-family HTH domain
MPESEEIIIGNKLKEARIRKGFSIEELADILSLSINQIQQIEDGGITAFYSYSWKVRVARRVGYILDVSEAEFISQ